METPRHTPAAMTPVVASIAAAWTPTAAKCQYQRARRSVSRAGLSARHIDANAGTSINPDPCAVAIRKDQSAMRAWPPRALIGVRRPAASSKRVEATPTSSAPAKPLNQRTIHRQAMRKRRKPRSRSAQHAPCRLGKRARRACDSSRACTPHAAENIQTLAGFNPCKAPTPATDSHGQKVAFIRTSGVCAARGGRLGARFRLVTIVVTHPRHAIAEVLFVAALGDEIEHVVRAHHDISAAIEGRVGVERFRPRHSWRTG